MLCVGQTTAFSSCVLPSLSRSRSRTEGDAERKWTTGGEGGVGAGARVSERGAWGTA